MVKKGELVSVLNSQRTMNPERRRGVTGREVKGDRGGRDYAVLNVTVYPVGPAWIRAGLREAASEMRSPKPRAMRHMAMVESWSLEVSDS